MFNIQKRTLKFIAIFLSFLAIAILMPSPFAYLPDASVQTSEASDPLCDTEHECGSGCATEAGFAEAGIASASGASMHNPDFDSEYEPAPLLEPENQYEDEALRESLPESGSESELDELSEPELEADSVVTITISAAGDITLGGCPVRGSYYVFMGEFEEIGRDYSYFLRNVRHIFMDDDLTIVNFEGTLTSETVHRGNPFNFRAAPSFAKVLSSSGVEAATLANNHSGDFLEAGYLDTQENLEAEGIAFFGNETNAVLKVNGVNIGLYGFLTWNDTQEHRSQVIAATNELKERGADLIIAYFHWGIETHYRPTSDQQSLGRFAIDNGADLVLGAHPHVLQGIEVYKDRNIVYSLANFSFGGNRNPFDMDSFIFQQTFTFENGLLLETNETNIIPIRTTSALSHNNYQPTIAQGQAAERILGLIESLSDELNR